MFLKSVIRLF